MRIGPALRRSTLLAAVVIALAPALAQRSPYATVSSPLKVDTTTTIPGASLKPGSYRIRVVDNLKDRYIFSVADERNKDLATFIGMLQRGPLPGQGGPGPVLWENAPGKTNALRGFSFPNGHVFEFVYPKATAVELAKINASSVPAIDPESEGMPVDPKLTPEDRRVVTLWLLTSTRVGPGNVPAIEARRAQPAENTELAQVSDPLSAAPKPAVAASTKPAPPVNAGLPRQAVGPPAKTKSRAVAAKLPQTASDLPLMLLLSGVLFAVGFGIAAGRRSSFRV